MPIVMIMIMIMITTTTTIITLDVAEAVAAGLTSTALKTRRLMTMRTTTELTDRRNHF